MYLIKVKKVSHNAKYLHKKSTSIFFMFTANKSDAKQFKTSSEAEQILLDSQENSNRDISNYCVASFDE